MRTRHRKILLLVFLSGAILLCLSALMLVDVRCVLVRTDDGDVVHATSVRDGDRMVISHINSMYDAPVEEHLHIHENRFVLTKVVTDSQGVLEYYGVADAAPRGTWSAIRIFSTEGRNFALTIKEIPVDALKKERDSHFTVRIENHPLYRFLALKMQRPVDSGSNPRTLSGHPVRKDP